MKQRIFHCSFLPIYCIAKSHWVAVWTQNLHFIKPLHINFKSFPQTGNLKVISLCRPVKSNGFYEENLKTTQFPNYFPFEMYLPLHLKNMIPFPCKAYLAPNWLKSVSVLVQEKNRKHLKVYDRNKNYGNNWKMDKL